MIMNYTTRIACLLVIGLLGGTDRLCTRLMEVTSGRILAKVGAEGVLAVAVGVLVVRELGGRRVEALPDSRQPAVDRAGVPGWVELVVQAQRGHRVGDMRRLVRQYGRGAETVR